MTYTEYVELASRTCPDLGSLEKNLDHMDMGIITEFGELIDQYKRNLAYGKDLDLVNIKEELGDIYWYIANKERLINSTDDTREIVDYLANTKTFTANISSLMFTLNKYLSHRKTKDLMSRLEIFIIDFGWKVEDIWKLNINKLKTRFPEKFTQEKALNRDLDKEREVLER